MFELWRKNRELHRVQRYYDTEIKKAKKEHKSSDEIDNLKTGLQADTYFIEEEINSLVTNQLVEKAHRLFLPVPTYDYDKNEMFDSIWERGTMTGRSYLTPNGIMTLRNLIREETAARRKAILEWVAPFIGIIGAITGLLAVILAMT